MFNLFKKETDVEKLRKYAFHKPCKAKMEKLHMIGVSFVPGRDSIILQCPKCYIQVELTVDDAFNIIPKLEKIQK